MTGFLPSLVNRMNLGPAWLLPAFTSLGGSTHLLQSPVPRSISGDVFLGDRAGLLSYMGSSACYRAPWSIARATLANRRAEMMNTLTAVYFGNPVWAWTAAALVAAVFFVVAAVLKRFLRKRLESHPDVAGLPRRMIHQCVRNTSLLLVFGASLWMVCLILAVPDKWARVCQTLAILSGATQGAVWIHSLITLLAGQGGVRVTERNPGAATTVGALGLVGKALLWTLMALLVLHNAGVNITALIAGLGIGGVAVALALQTILADVFASISILLDKPYQVGDFIAVGDSMGTVEAIGIKTTRLRSLSGEQLVFSNGELLKSRIRNFMRMTERRVEFSIGVAYSTPYLKVELIPSMLREIISSNEQVRLERANFKEFGEGSLTFECVYFVKDLSYTVFLGVQESINLEILRRFQVEEIELAHPQRTLYVAQGVAPVRW
jgi:small-conductance mechanosensitive channel